MEEKENMKHTLGLRYIIGDEVYISDGCHGYQKTTIKEITITKDGIFYNCGYYNNSNFTYKENTDKQMEVIHISDMDGSNIDTDEIIIYHMFVKSTLYIFVIKAGRLKLKTKSNGIINNELGNEIQEWCIEKAKKYLHNNIPGLIKKDDSFWLTMKKHCMGMTIDEIKEYFKNNPNYLIRKYPSPTSQNTSIVVSVKPPKLERYNENSNKDTFDIIRVEIVLVSSIKNRKEEIVKCKDEIIGMALEKIQFSKRFQQFNIPINILSLYDFTITVDNSVLLSFCIKEKKKEDS